MDEQEVERRVNVAVELQSIADEIKGMQSRFDNVDRQQDSCKLDRDALFKRIRQIDVQLGVVEAKQKGVLRVLWLMGAGVIGGIGNAIWKSFHH